MRSVSQDVPIGSSEISLVQLNERSREIFRQIVESYLATGEPVGSRNLSRIIPMTLSPASVRNVMQDLEQLGLIYAPHTSAGRLPTELGLEILRRCPDADRRSERQGSRRHRRPGRGGGKNRRERADGGLRTVVGPRPRRRRRAHRQGQCAVEAYRVRPAGARARSRHSGGGGRPGREPRPQSSDRAADVVARRSRELPQYPYPRQDAGGGQGANWRRRSKPAVPSSIN